MDTFLKQNYDEADIELYEIDIDEYLSIFSNDENGSQGTLENNN